MGPIIVVDSGTTNTRVRVWHGGIVATASAPVGARDTAREGHNGAMRAALRRLVDAVTAKAGEQPEALVAAGMITANVGLLEVPQLLAPAGPVELARAIVRHDFPDISPLPFYFIPGIRVVPSELTLQSLDQADLIRGEETEVAGLRHLLGLKGPVIFLHCGSHHKAIQVDADGRVVASRTALTGELLMAVAQETVLRSSVVSLDGFEPDPALFRAGLAHAVANGFGRALFLTRVVEQVWQRSKGEATSFLLGVLASQDLPLLAGARESGCPVVIYGKGHFPSLLKAHLDAEGWPAVSVATETTAELAAAVGAVRIYEQLLRNRSEGSWKE